MKQAVIKISPRQFMLLTLLYTLGSAVILSPPSLIQAAKQDAWLSGLIGTCLGLLLLGLYIAMSKAHPNQNLFEMLESLFGKIGGKLIGSLYLFYAFILSSQVLSNLGDFIVTQIMIETPKEFIELLFIIPVIYGVRLGIEVIGRSAEVLYPVIIIFFIILVIFLLPQVELENIKPVFGEGFKAHLRGSIAIFSFPFLEMIILLTIYPLAYVKNGRAFLYGGMLGGLSLALLTFLIVIVLGYEYSLKVLYPTFSLAKKVNIADFIQRVEVVITAVWIITLFFKLCLCSYITVKGFSQMAGIADHKPLSFPIGIVIWFLSIIIYPNIAYFQAFVKASLGYKLVLGLFIPLLLLLISFIKKWWQQKKKAAIKTA
ncbi:spore germination protein KB [Bacillus ectoiniformans]|uniref:GerAB/ArcD/ProY family transporter n=1 Tax=Bacillus ectoiniformans TaxID=1494429 RepID=UPI001956B49A|nr:endospore germination permease [Bacillus ectoiniformans]MBM7649609.1 spore germination protein KB [Bacillus ectoiniformans]